MNETELLNKLNQIEAKLDQLLKEHRPADTPLTKAYELALELRAKMLEGRLSDPRSPQPKPPA